MRKLPILFALLLFTSTAFSQTATDSLRVGKTGSARGVATIYVSPDGDTIYVRMKDGTVHAVVPGASSGSSFDASGIRDTTGDFSVWAKPLYFVSPVFSGHTDAEHYTTLSAAVTAASDGQTIKVEDGTYTNNITFGGKTLHIELGSDVNINANLTIATGDTITLSGGNYSGTLTQTGGKLRWAGLPTISAGNPGSVLSGNAVADIDAFRFQKTAGSSWGIKTTQNSRLTLRGDTLTTGDWLGQIILATDHSSAKVSGYYLGDIQVQDSATLIVDGLRGYGWVFSDADTTDTLRVLNSLIQDTLYNAGGRHAIEVQGGFFTMDNSVVKSGENNPNYVGSAIDFNIAPYRADINNSSITAYYCSALYERAVSFGGYGKKVRLLNSSVTKLNSTGSAITIGQPTWPFNVILSNVSAYSDSANAVQFADGARSYNTTGDTLILDVHGAVGGSQAIIGSTGIGAGDFVDTLDMVARNNPKTARLIFNGRLYGTTQFNVLNGDSITSTVGNLKIASPNTGAVDAYNNWNIHNNIIGKRNYFGGGLGDLVLQSGLAGGYVVLANSAGNYGLYVDDSRNVQFYGGLAMGSDGLYRNGANGGAKFYDEATASFTGLGTISSGAITVTGASSYYKHGGWTTAQRDALTPSNGMYGYNNTTDKFNFREGGGWTAFEPLGATSITASNLGGGVANFSGRSVNDLQFNSFNTSHFSLGANLISLNATFLAALRAEMGDTTRAYAAVIDTTGYGAIIAAGHIPGLKINATKDTLFVFDATTSVSGGSAEGVTFWTGATTLSNDATNFFWETTANGNFLRIGAGTSPGELRLREGSAAGTNEVTVRAPVSLSASVTYELQPLVYEVALSDETTAISTTGTKRTFRAPCKMNVVAVRASVGTVSSSGTPTFDINEGGVSILSTTLTIDANEKTSTTAAVAYVISDATIADDAEITIDIDVTGTGTAGAKVKIYYWPVP